MSGLTTGGSSGRSPVLVGDLSGGDFRAGLRCGAARLGAERPEGLADLFHQAGRIEPQHSPEIRHGAVVDEPVARDPDDPHSYLAIGRIREPRLLDPVSYTHLTLPTIYSV